MDPLSHTLSGVIRVGVNVADPLSRAPSGAALAPPKLPPWTNIRPSGQARNFQVEAAWQ